MCLSNFLGFEAKTKKYLDCYCDVPLGNLLFTHTCQSFFFSSNGTFVNGEKIGKSYDCLLLKH